MIQTEDHAMLTAKDIEEKVFDKAVRGYNADQVDEFLDEITAAITELTQQNGTLSEQLSSVTAKLEEYKAQESSVITTLESARALMNDISASAEKRADIIMKNAELDADQMIKNARESVEKLKEEEKELAQRIGSLKHRLKNILQTELDRFESIDQDVFGATLSAPASASETAESPQAQFDRLTKVDMEPVDDDKFKTRVFGKE